MAPAWRSRLIWALVVLGGWTLMAALFTPQHWVLTRRAPSPPRWTELFLGNLAMFWIWAALTPVILWFGRRYPLERRRFAARLPLFFVAGFVFTLIHITLVRYTNAILTGQPRQPYINFLVGYGATGVLIAWNVLAASQAVTYFRRFHDREFRLVQAQLQSLKTQLHPHFLFNTLNAIAELLHQDPLRAERTLTQLSDLLRHALERGDAQEVPLKEEIDFLRNYVRIQQTLLQERLSVRWHIDDATLDACVPAMLLQPIVENAVQHGVGPRASGGTIDVSARLDGAMLKVAVEDDGVGMPLGARRGEEAEGIGLSNTRARLQHMYGSDHSFVIEPRAGGGVSVHLAVPFRIADPKAAGRSPLARGTVS